MDIGTKQHIHTTVDCVMNYYRGRDCYYGHFGRYHSPTFKILWIDESIAMNEWLFTNDYYQRWSFFLLTNFHAWY